MKNFNILNIFILYAVFVSCTNRERNEKKFETLARKNIEILNSGGLKTLQCWDYSQRGNFWLNTDGDNMRYSCSFHFSIDTPQLIVNRPDTFLRDFGGKMNINSAYDRILLTKISNGSLKLFGTNRFGQDTLLENNLSFQKTFPGRDPFASFDSLTRLKDKLKVTGIVHESNLGGFVQFYFQDGQHILTYLPDTLLNSNSFNKFWKEEFLKGKKLAPNWNFRKLEAPIDGG